MARISVVNVVGHMDFNRELKLSAVQELLEGSNVVDRVIFNPSENHWLQTWFKSPQTNKQRYVSFYRSGTAVVTGCSSEDEFYKLGELIQSAMESVGTTSTVMEIKNVVATSEIGRFVELSELAVGLGLENVEYEPEQFPGLIYRDEANNCVFLIFTSGRIVCTGLNSERDVETVFDEFIEYLNSITA